MSNFYRVNPFLAFFPHYFCACITDECGVESRNEKEQRAEVEGESHLDSSQSRNRKVQKLMNNDHFYATSVPESNGIQQNASVISQDAVQLQKATDVKDETENSCKLAINLMYLKFRIFLSIA